jgi:hypothetical protein
MVVGAQDILALPCCMVDPRNLPFFDHSAFCVTSEDPFEKFRKGLCLLEPLFDQKSIRPSKCISFPQDTFETKTCHHVCCQIEPLSAF